MGLLVNIEAIDGAGKDTQLHRVAKVFRQRGLRVHVLSFPLYEQSVTGEFITSFLHGTLNLNAEAAQVLFSMNRREGLDRLTAAIGEDDLVLVGRYNLSGRVFGEATGVRPEIVAAFEARFPPVDRLILLDAAPEQLAQRRHEHDRYESSSSLQQTTRELYLRYVDPAITQIIDATGTIEEITDAIAQGLCAQVYEYPIERWLPAHHGGQAHPCIFAEAYS